MSSYSYYPIKGIPVEDGKPIPLRLEIDDLWQANTLEHENQKSLFVRALQILQDTDPDERLSYFQIAGIHGMPYHEWDQPKPLKYHGMYCAHDTVLFPTWHRPYLLLFEQCLHKIMVKDIIPHFANDIQVEMRKAADTWRLPYWDWAALRGNPKALDVPIAITEEWVSIRGFTANIDRVPNPLWKFRMPKPKDEKKGDTMEAYGVTKIAYKDATFYFEKCVATNKYPDLTKFNPEVKQHSRVEYDEQRWNLIRSCLRDPTSKIVSKEEGHKQDTLREAVYRLFTYERLKDYRTFATSKYQDEQRIPDYISLEHVHNNLHNWIGGGGHMSHVPVSSFDPIFWLHHCNIDRYLAIWQALNVESWFEAGGRHVLGSKTDLEPFHPDNSPEFYNSDLCRYTTNLGYAYPETKPGLKRDDTYAKVKELYASLQELEQAIPPPTSKISLKQNDLNELRDYVVNVSYEKFALEGTPFTVHIFIGKVPATTPYNYLPGSTQVGNVYNFVAPPTREFQQGCDNCAKQMAEGIKVAGQVILTNSLLERIIEGTRHEYGSTDDDSFHYLRSMRRSDVIPFLKVNLHWRVSKLNGELVDRENLRGFKVSVAAGLADFYPDNSSQPAKYYDYEVAYGVTETREEIGGVAPNDGTYAT